MAWLRRDDQTTPEGEQEWISDLLDPLHGHDGDTHDASGLDHSPDDGADPVATRSAADVLAAANRTGETIGLSTTEPETTEAPSESGSDTKDASEAELPADYATRVPTTGEIPSIDETRTNIAPSLAQIMQIEGALGAALVDYASGQTLDSRSIDGAPDMAQAAAGESAVLRTKIASLVQLDSDDDVDEVLATLSTQYHLTRMVRETETTGLFLYLILDRQLANLAMARHKLALAARQLEA